MTDLFTSHCTTQIWAFLHYCNDIQIQLDDNRVIRKYIIGDKFPWNTVIFNTVVRPSVNSFSTQTSLFVHFCMNTNNQLLTFCAQASTFIHQNQFRSKIYAYRQAYIYSDPHTHWGKYLHANTHAHMHTCVHIHTETKTNTYTSLHACITDWRQTIAFPKVDLHLNT